MGMPPFTLRIEAGHPSPIPRCWCTWWTRIPRWSTNNWIDFCPMVARLEVHPGIVVILPNVRRERQMELFAAALGAIQEHDPPLDMINTVLQVDADGSVTMFPLPPL